MNIAYTIMSVNDSRKENKEKIRYTIETAEELINKITYYDCRNNPELKLAVDRYKHLNWNLGNPRRGHFGVWASTISAWEFIAKSNYDGVIVFEDDATLHPHFDFLLKKYMVELPENWDFFTLHNPHNQNADYLWDYHWNEKGEYVGSPTFYQNGAPAFDVKKEHLCRSFQGYGGVAIMYSPKGAQKFLDHLNKVGVWSSSDCQIFQMSKFSRGGGVNGYSVKPMHTKPATTALDSETQIHNSELINLSAMLQEARDE